MAGKGDKKIDFGVLKSMVQKSVSHKPPSCGVGEAVSS